MSNSSESLNEITQDGSRAAMAEKTLQLLKANPGKTANELEELGGFKDGQIRKRLNDLLRQELASQGPARVSEVTGKPNLTWYTKEDAELLGIEREARPITCKAKVTNSSGVTEYDMVLNESTKDGQCITFMFPVAVTIYPEDSVKMTWTFKAE